MSNKQNFIKGTFILVIANAVSKILGAVFKIPLTYILREEGMAIYSTAFSVYIMILSFITSGVSMAISKMVAEELALKHKGRRGKLWPPPPPCWRRRGFSAARSCFSGRNFRRRHEGFKSRPCHPDAVALHFLCCRGDGV